MAPLVPLLGRLLFCSLTASQDCLGSAVAHPSGCWGLSLPAGAAGRGYFEGATWAPARRACSSASLSRA